MDPDDMKHRTAAKVFQLALGPLQSARSRPQSELVEIARERLEQQKLQTEMRLKWQKARSFNRNS